MVKCATSKFVDERHAMPRRRVMSDPKSVSQWIEDLKQGDEDAAARLWERYFLKMVQAARQKLWRHNLAVADEEDVALSAFDSLCRGAAIGNFTELHDRHDLWPLLLTITAQKSIDRIRWENRQRRGGGRNVVRDTDLPETGQVTTLDEILSAGPTPEFLVLMDEQCSGLLAQLRDDTLRSIVKWKLEGHTNDGIAGFLGVSVHTVGRKLRMIRLAWSKELDATR
jgi:DNA-directed RNA polymerase specialized sigma24 family protein